MKPVYLFCFSFLLLSVFAYGQPELKLSDEHLSKVLTEDNPVKKRQLYLKYFHKDSIRHVKEVDRYWQSKLDSSSAWVSDRRKKLLSIKDRILSTTQVTGKRLQADFMLDEDVYRMPLQLEMKFTNNGLKVHYDITRLFLIEAAKDSAHLIMSFDFQQFAIASKIPDINKAGDAFSPANLNPFKRLKLKGKDLVGKRINNNEALTKAKELNGEASQYLGEYQKYQGYADLSSDSLKQIAVSRFEGVAQKELMSLSGVKGYQKEMAQFSAMQNQYKSQLKDLNDSTARKEMAKQKAEELAMKYIHDNPGVMQGVQKKMNLLMKKYSTVTNSNDLSTAIKRTSLSGRTFKERLVVAANFQLLNINPVSIDFSPQVGYRFNSLLSLGIGGTYRKTIRDSVPTLSPDAFGYKAFISYDVIKSFFAYGEYAQNSPGVMMQEGISKRIWKPAALLGIGRRLSIHKNVDMTVVALYNFMHTPGDPIYPRPFMVRVGFQLSDIALLKRKPDVKLF